MKKWQTPQRDLCTLTLWFWIKLDIRTQQKHHPGWESTSTWPLRWAVTEERRRLSWVNFCWAALQPDPPGLVLPFFGVPASEVSAGSHVSSGISISTGPIWLWPQPANGALWPTRCLWFSSVDGGWAMRSSRWTAMLTGWLTHCQPKHTYSPLYYHLP